MNLIFLGGFFPKQYISSILKKSKLQIQNAANNFQWAFINGLEQNLDQPIKLITAPFIGWYPKFYKDLIIRTKYLTNKNNIDVGIMVGFLNLPQIKHVFRFLNLYKNLKKLLSSTQENIIIVYSLDFSLLKSALLLKKNNPKLKICVIITDCYDYNENSNKFHKLYLKYIYNPILNNFLSQIDLFVVLTDKIVDLLKLQNKPWVRIEGIFDENSNIQKININKNRSIKIVLYTGTLEYPYGIKQLLDAFKLIEDPDYRLWICGGGTGITLVNNRALYDNRIQYYGIVSTEKITELQAAATILVNPRNNIGEYNKYSFPSKTIEYLASGTPTLIYKLDGIPEEYFDYCFTVKDNEINSLANAIYCTCQMNPSFLKEKGENARNFILANKTAKIQCGKVMKMIESF